MKHIKLFESFNHSYSKLILYHGSNEKFDSFELKSGIRTTMMFSENKKSHGIFLTDDKEIAITYTNKETTSYLYTCELKCINSISWIDGVDDDTYNKFENNIPYDNSELWLLLDDESIVNNLKDREIDCVLLEEYSESIRDVFKTYFILEPENINIIKREII